MTTDTVLKTKEDQQIRTVKLWNVIIHNDDYTPIDFVIILLMRCANKSSDEAEAIATQVHHEDKGIVGTYTREVAEMRVKSMMELSQLNGHPLLTTCEEA